jgi:tetratricopeptide (TPR) repeat protein
MASDNSELDGMQRAALDELLARARALADMPETDVHIVELLSVYVRFDSQNGIAWFHLGDALRNIGRLKEAEDALLKAVSLAPSTSKFAVYARIGMVTAKRSSPSDAEKWYRLATADAGCPGWMWCLRGANLLRTEDYALAKTCLEAALTSDDVVRDEVFLNLALIARAQKHYDEARALLEQALALDANNEDTKAVLASIRDIEKSVAEAASIAERISTGNTLSAGK